MRSREPNRSQSSERLTKWEWSAVLKSSILSFLGRGSQDPRHSAAVLASAEPAPDARRHVRTQTSVPVVLHLGAENAPAIIANLSPAGAMVKSSLQPSTGDEVLLVRGGLCSQGTAIWCLDDEICGIEFAAQIDLNEWLAPIANAGQARVDEIVALLKAGALGHENTESDAPATTGQSWGLKDDLALIRALLKNLRDDLSGSSETLDRHSSKIAHLDQATEILSDPKLLRRSHYQLVDELGGVLQLLVEVEDELSRTTDTVARHGYKLQHLDLAMQMLTELGSELVVGGEDRLSSSPRLQNLRGVCDNALKGARAE